MSLNIVETSSQLPGSEILKSALKAVSLLFLRLTHNPLHPTHMTINPYLDHYPVHELVLKLSTPPGIAVVYHMVCWLDYHLYYQRVFFLHKVAWLCLRSVVRSVALGLWLDFNPRFTLWQLLISFSIKIFLNKIYYYVQKHIPTWMDNKYAMIVCTTGRQTDFIQSFWKYACTYALFIWSFKCELNFLQIQWFPKYTIAWRIQDKVNFKGPAYSSTGFTQS